MTKKRITDRFLSHKSKAPTSEEREQLRRLQQIKDELKREQNEKRKRDDQ